jgi:hypothetical protein
MAIKEGWNEEQEAKAEPELGSPELMNEWYDEDKFLDFFVYQSVRCEKSKKLRKGYDVRHNAPPEIPKWVESLQTFVSTCGLLFMQIAVPSMLCYRFAVEVLEKYEERPTRDPFNRLAGCVFMFGAIRVMVSDINNLGQTYFALGKWHSIRGRRLRWMALGMVANVFSIFATELALFTSFLLTDDLLDFVFNFAALFVLYQVDAFILSSDEKAEVTRFVENLQPEDMDIEQDHARFSGLYCTVHALMLFAYFSQQFVLQFALPVLFAAIY